MKNNIAQLDTREEMANRPRFGVYDGDKMDVELQDTKAEDKHLSSKFTQTSRFGDLFFVPTPGRREWAVEQKHAAKCRKAETIGSLSEQDGRRGVLYVFPSVRFVLSDADHTASHSLRRVSGSCYKGNRLCHVSFACVASFACHSRGGCGSIRVFDHRWYVTV